MIPSSSSHAVRSAKRALSNLTRARPWQAGCDRFISGAPPASMAAEVTLERLTEGCEGIAVLTLDRPVAKNAIGRTLLSELQGAIRSHDPSHGSGTACAVWLALQLAAAALLP
ncbi:hypothetical protein CYMTET_18771 [Cymbomonas tetramitiformis]|uniref:Uncharacterized protein n=1 Tax=Cymbomonas tetramitiformis TaxID=36881 RepID=A0AAE0G7G8_9CHLO|nr:hypothetical protein CYMTET_18771 [Cymbomonas tetramitiformis]